MSNYVVQGILFYSTIYISTILTVITFLTGRWIFIFFILLTFALAIYMGYLSTHNHDFIIKSGQWIDDTLLKYINKFL